MTGIIKNHNQEPVRKNKASAANGVSAMIVSRLLSRNPRVPLAATVPVGSCAGPAWGRSAKRTPRSARVAAALARVTRSSCSPGSSRPARQCSPSSAIALSRSALPTRAVFPYTVVRPGHFAVLVAREVHPARQQPHARPVARVVCHGIHSRLSGPRHPGASGRR